MSRNHTLQTYSAQSGKNTQLGQAGYVILQTDGTGFFHTDTGHYVAITALADDALITIVADSIHDEDSTTFSIGPLPAGTTIYGQWNKVSLSRSGSSDTTIIIYTG